MGPKKRDYENWIKGSQETPRLQRKRLKVVLGWLLQPAQSQAIFDTIGTFLVARLVLLILLCFLGDFKLMDLFQLRVLQPPSIQWIGI